MPIYEYECRACDHEFEHFARSMRDETDVTCPQCSSRKVNRRLSVFAARQGAAAASGPADSPCARCGDPGGACPYK